MYNDYYLQSIDNKLSTTNNNLDDIINNQQSIIENQQTIISGDIYIRQYLYEYTKCSLTLSMVLCFFFAFFILAELVEHFLGMR